jgi:hypothetical protein
MTGVAAGLTTAWCTLELDANGWSSSGQHVAAHRRNARLC